MSNIEPNALEAPESDRSESVSDDPPGDLTEPPGAGTADPTAAADPPAASTPRRLRERLKISSLVARENLPATVFGVYIVAAFVVLVGVVGADRWFMRDEWYFLAGRNALSLSDLARPHGEHLSTIPVLSYRVLYAVFGIRSYLPYLAVVVLLHLTAAVLLRVVMLRSQVQPWIATLTAAIFVLYGAGEENIVWAFQVGMTGSVTFGLAHLLLADRDGGLGRMDFLALTFGLASVMSTGIGPLMVAATGVAMLLRRGWRAAAFHTVPLGVLYGIWYAIEKPRTNTAFGNPSTEVLFAWIREGVVGAYLGIAQYPAAAVAIGVLTVSGVLLAWVRLPWTQFRREAALPLGLVLAVPLLFASTAWGRWVFGEQFARSSRYVYVATVFLLPVIAVAASAYVRRWRYAAIPIAALLFVGIPGNAFRFNDSVFGPAYFTSQRNAILGSAHSPLAEQVPKWVQPLPDIFNGEDLDIGWLLEAKRAGRLPSAPELPPKVAATIPIRLGLAHRATGEPAPTNCTSIKDHLDLTPQTDDRIRLLQPVYVWRLEDGKVTSDPVPFTPADGDTLRVTLDGLSFRITPQTPNLRPTVCL